MSTLTAGGAIFTRLKALGVDYVFANSGTDFPPIIEGLAEAQAKGIDLPQALVIPHEHAAMGMAHGYYLMTGKAQAVMLHTNVGLANGSIGAINAACDHIPMILMSGRTPVMEEGRFGARTVPIGWGQEMRDQTALVREACKWEYELKFPEQITGLLDRAHAIANSTPKGPVYLSLPREVLCDPVEGDISAPPSIAPSAAGPDPAAIQTAARWLAEAKNPLIIAPRGAGDAPTFDAFSDWVDDWGIGVCTWWANQLPLPTNHPCHLGDNPGPAMARADVVVILNGLAPWWPDKHKLAAGAKVINIGPDPIFSRFPVRNFPSDLSIAGETRLTIPALIETMAELPRETDSIAFRRQELAREAAEVAANAVGTALANAERGMTKEYVSHCLGEALGDLPSSVFSELGTRLTSIRRTRHNSWFQEPNSGGLGWCLPAAMGAKLADRDRIVVATMGDGSYMFANPVACHQIMEALELPVLILILNNEEWGAVRNSVVGLYPDGYAAKSNKMPLTALQPTPDFCKVAEASRAWARRVTQADALPDALTEALAVVQEGTRPALLDISILPG